MKTKIGLIGCGKWARQSCLPYLTDNPTIELTSLSGISLEEPGAQIAKDLGFLRYYDHWEEMIETEKLDGVVVTTPHALHYAQVKGCIERGIHVQVDKPPALTSAELEDLLQLAAKKNVIVNVHTQRRFFPEYQYAKHVVSEGQLGDIQFVQGDFGQRLFTDFRGSWRANPELAGGGIMMDSGYHILDIALHILGIPDVKSVVMSSNNGEFLSDTFTALSFTLESGCLVSLNVIKGLPQNVAIERLQIVGNKGWLSILRDKRNGQAMLLIEHYDIDGQPRRLTQGEASRVDISAPIQNFIEAITGNTTLLSPLHDARTTVKVLEAGYISASKTQIVFPS